MKPWLLLPPQWAHDLGPWALPFLALFADPKTHSWQGRNWRGLHFRNPTGLAGGADKNGESLLPWQKFGVGFIEVGTVTPLAQKANQGKIIDRSISEQAVWNKMGFPNKGAQALRQKLLSIKPHLQVPLFVNIGKNRQTPNNQASQDYISCLQTLADVADVFVINISSPNTQDLRELLKKENLQPFLESILEKHHRICPKTPLLLKLSPDMESASLFEALDISLQLQIDGWILTNTTLSRSPNLTFPTEGGVSGRPLKSRSLENLYLSTNYLKAKKQDQLLISTGGIESYDDVRQRLDAGADLVQLYSALVFHGPFLFQEIANTASRRTVTNNPK